MNCSRFGTQLSIDIRLALSSLGRDPFDKKVDRMTIKQKKALFAELRAEQRQVGGILKEGV
ncbi:hypothetical protein UFOVP143_31 [uncultured Caudovirales phage]|uniref:Uncharacterized protein n=1 Tax=uncultured Caudovirales phage TaxID=2100421 RepID=A0A6J7VNV4_9CAUD|nr:hypothetical protein UFOVP143_31 [uncultured Caudovirales phage]